jgi:PilZ domain
MVEDRAAPRYRVKKPAWIEHGGDKTACTVRDLSLTGALLEVSDPRTAPETFTLIIPEDGLKIACRLVRRTEFRMGVKFE